MSEITKKQLAYIHVNHIEHTLRTIGLKPTDLTKKQAKIIINNHKEKLKKQQKSACSSSTDFSSSTDLEKLLGRIPDYDRYPYCGYDRSWCG